METAFEETTKDPLRAVCSAVTLVDIGKMAGLFEADGCFLVERKAPAMNYTVDDRDVVEWVARLLGTKVAGPYSSKHRTKVRWRARVRGQKAVEWMYTLYPLMGDRRRSKIRECISLWRVAPGSASTQFKGK